MKSSSRIGHDMFSRPSRENCQVSTYFLKQSGRQMEPRWFECYFAQREASKFKRWRGIRRTSLYGVWDMPCSPAVLRYRKFKLRAAPTGNIRAARLLRFNFSFGDVTRLTPWRLHSCRHSLGSSIDGQVDPLYPTVHSRLWTLTAICHVHI